MSLLIIIPAFLVTIGVLVTVHEFGHFWVARKLGVKVLRFSVGFGQPLWKKVSKDADRIEYVVAALPLGGYVKMLDERECEAGESIPEADLPRAFNRQPVWKRAAIVAAGPIANFLLAIFIYALTFMIGVDAMRPVVDVTANTPAAQAGFQTGDQLISINDQPVESWEDARMLLVEEYLKSTRIQFAVKTRDNVNALRTVELGDKPMFKDETDFLDKVGLSLWVRGVGIAQVLPNTPAERAGLQGQDRILLVDGKPLDNAQQFIQYVQAHNSQAVELQIMRGDNEASAKQLTISVTPESKQLEGKTVGSIGAAVGQYMTSEMRNQLVFTQRYAPHEALWHGVVKTKQMSLVTLKLMGRMLTGDVSIKNISGPVTIAQFAGETASIGLITFLGFLAIVSVSLGVLNLLPIPMLDGGHLLYYLIEVVKGSPVSEQFEAVGLKIGMAFIGALMVLALYNDLMRLMN